MKRLITVGLVAMFCLGLGACNTMAGAGKDVQKAGEKGEQEAVGRMDGHC